jgi:DNA-binding NtrC family response regulator
MPAHLLFVEDDPLIRRSVAGHLREVGHRVREAENVAAARRFLESEVYDAVLVDFRLPDGTGFDVMAHAAERQSSAPVIMLTGHGSVENAVEAMRRGAFTYLQKPVEPEEIEVHLATALETSDLRRENRRLRRLAEPGVGASAFLGTSPAAREVREQVVRVAASPARAILLEGESGTGKGLVARAIHDESGRAGRAYVPITCSAMPETLLESELFGHEPGAFTDARKRKMGLLEAAEGGTLFLDEIGDMAPPLQAKLLGVLEERRFRRVGGLHEIEADVRVVSATHRDLRSMTKEGRFREDLLYRLRVVPIRIPSLRERPEDIALLARHFTERIAAEWGRPPLRLPDDAVASLSARPWPGNVRELRNAIERAVILARGDVLEADDLREERDGAAGATGFVLPGEGVDVEALFDDLLKQALERTGGNQSAAARLLRMSRDQVRYRMARFASPEKPAADGPAS